MVATAATYWTEVGLESLFASLPDAEDDAIPPDLDDLVRLHRTVRERPCVTVLELGVGYSTIVLAHALSLVEEEHGAVLRERLGRNQHLGRFAEIAFSEDSRSRRISIPDLHAAVDLGERQSPFVQFSEQSPVATVASQVVQRVFVLREHQELHLRVHKDTLTRQQFFKLEELRFNLSLLQLPGVVDEFC